MSFKTHDQDPTHSIGFLLTEVTRLMRRDFEQRSQHLNLTPAQWRALARLSRCQGINQATLADLLEIQPITLTRQIDKLETAGWVQRRPDPHDRRAVRLHLTPAAEPLLAELKLVAEVTLGRAMSGLPPSDQARFATILERMKDNLLQAADGDVALPSRTGTHG
jgi:DNA-binding MarR family transcriptional regulator